MRTPVRVLQVLTCDTLGGTELMVATLVERTDPSVVDCTVAILDRPGPIASRLVRSALSVHSLGGLGLVVSFVRLARLIARGRYDVVNAYGFKSTSVVRVLVRLLSSRSRFVAGVRAEHPAEVERLDTPKAKLVLALERVGSHLVDVSE